MWFTVDQEVGRDVLDGWKEVTDLAGDIRRVRAFPPRLVHILAGNAPGVTAATILRGALTKGVNLLKLPSNDLFTGTAILRTMAEIDAEHPVTQSFSCVYWRGGDPDRRRRACSGRSTSIASPPGVAMPRSAAR